MTPGHGAVAGRPGRLLLSVDRNKIGVGPVGAAQPSCPGSHAGAPRRRRPLREEGRCFSILALRWLIVQLCTERLNRLIVDTDPSGPGAADVAGGRTDPPAGALSTAVGSEIQTYPGVRSDAHLTGDPDQPQMNLNVTVDPDVDVPRVRRRIVDEAVAHARTALDTPDLATQLKLTVARPTRDHRNYL